MIIFYVGDNVYLLCSGINIFKATYERTEVNSSVHGKMLDTNIGRFIINKILANAKKKFDVDVHSPGSPILCKLSQKKGTC